MAQFAMLYINACKELDRVIETDTYRIDTKFFTFLKGKEVIRSLKADCVPPIKRLDGEGEGVEASGD